MKWPSKREVRDAIRMLAAVQMSPSRASLGDFRQTGACNLAVDARHSLAAQSDSADGYRDSCAAAESLLLQGWLPYGPDEDAR